MTATDTIDQLQAQLDLQPDDWTLRGVLADALDEMGSELAAGYRAMAVCRLTACDYDEDRGRKWLPAEACLWFSEDEYGYTESDVYGFPIHSLLPDNWFSLLPGEDSDYPEHYKTFPNRRAAEDAAALAFTKLSPVRQRELLSDLSPVTGANREEQ